MAAFCVGVVTSQKVKPHLIKEVWSLDAAMDTIQSPILHVF